MQTYRTERKFEKRNVKVSQHTGIRPETKTKAKKIVQECREFATFIHTYECVSSGNIE